MGPYEAPMKAINGTNWVHTLTPRQLVLRTGVRTDRAQGQATERGNPMEIFNMTIPLPLFWTIVVVLIIAIILIIAIPMYKGYKKEMEKPVKKSGTKSGTKKK